MNSRRQQFYYEALSDCLPPFTQHTSVIAPLLSAQMAPLPLRRKEFSIANGKYTYVLFACSGCSSYYLKWDSHTSCRHKPGIAGTDTHTLVLNAIEQIDLQHQCRDLADLQRLYSSNSEAFVASVSRDIQQQVYDRHGGSYSIPCAVAAFFGHSKLGGRCLRPYAIYRSTQGIFVGVQLYGVRMVEVSPHPDPPGSTHVTTVLATCYSPVELRVDFVRSGRHAADSQRAKECIKAGCCSSCFV